MAPRPTSMSHPLEPELLLTHASALRSMARALLHDEHAAEDVVQETWLRAWISPPRAGGSVGGWLRRVTEGFALQRRRAEGRRARREQDYAAQRPESIDSDQRSAVLRSVVEAVLALDEPYRETVLLRWFEGLPPREIAQRLNVRVATIDSRLQRAHERLRAKLEREFGDGSQRWRGLVAFVLGAPRTPPPLSTFVLPIAGVAVSLKLVSAALIAAVAVCLWIGWDRSQPPIVDSVALTSSKPSVGGAPELAGAAFDAIREVASPASPTEAPSTASASTERSSVLERGPFAFALRVEVVDSAERPIHGAEVFLGPASCSIVEFGATDWNGVLEREWHGFDARFEGVLFVRAAGNSTSLRRVSLASSTHPTLRFQMDPDTQALRIVSGRSLLFAASVVPRIEDEFTVDAAGNGIFVDSNFARVLASPKAEEVGGADVRTMMEPPIFRAQGVFDVIGIDALRADALSASTKLVIPATVRGIVLDEAGRPLTDLLVAGRTPNRWNTSAPCDRDGTFVFKDVPPGPMEICVGGGDRILVRKVLELASGDSSFLELRALRRTQLPLVLSAARSGHLAEWIVEARGVGADAPLLGVAITDADGVAVVGLDDDVPVQIYARPRGSRATAAVLVARGARAGASPLALEIALEMSLGSIGLIVDGSLSESAEARAWRLDTGEGVFFERDAVERGTSTDIVLESGALLPGPWRVELRTPGRGWTEIGIHDVAPKEKVDLGIVRLATPASMTLGSADPRVDRTLLSLRARVDGALVVWPEREYALPSKLMAPPGTPIEILRRPIVHEERAATLPFLDTLWLQAGVELRMEIPPPR